MSNGITGDNYAFAVSTYASRLTIEGVRHALCFFTDTNHAFLPLPAGRQGHVTRF